MWRLSRVSLRTFFSYLSIIHSHFARNKKQTDRQTEGGGEKINEKKLEKINTTQSRNIRTVSTLISISKRSCFYISEQSGNKRAKIHCQNLFRFADRSAAAAAAAAPPRCPGMTGVDKRWPITTLCRSIATLVISSLLFLPPMLLLLLPPYAGFLDVLLEGGEKNPRDEEEEEEE